MKAKEVINLCEEDTLTGREFNDQFEIYFIKKMKSIGAVELKKDSLGAKFVFGGGKENYRSVTKAAWKYGRELLKMIHNSSFFKSTDGFQLNIYWDDVDLEHEYRLLTECSLLNIFCYGSGKVDSLWMFDYVLHLDVVFTRRTSELLQDFNFVIPRKVFENVCVKVDEIAKAIRLVPFGGQG